jgi:ubiquinone/menaquinone biosynthesis C-methylase UbiE
MTARDGADAVRRNVREHAAVAPHYEAIHGEIFNPVEQARLREHLETALAFTRTLAKPPETLDFGCGTGNVTRHLLDLGCRVTAADVTPDFLEHVARTHGPTGRVRSVLLNGTDLAPVPDASVDLAVAYAVLHHVPDYLAAVDELARVLRPGGVMLIDHEAMETYWARPPAYAAYRKAARAAKRRERLLSPRALLRSLRERLSPPPSRHHGDIHVTAEDHVEWDRVTERLEAAGCAVVWREDFLLYRTKHSRRVWERHRGALADYRALAARKA